MRKLLGLHTEGDANVQPLSRRERREMEQRESERSVTKPLQDDEWEILVGEPEVAAPILPPIQTAAPVAQDKFPIAHPEMTAVPARDTQPRYDASPEPPQPYHPTVVQQSSPNLILAPTPQPWVPSAIHQRPEVQPTIAKKRGIGWKVFLLPIIPFVIFVICMSVKANVAGALVFLLWIMSVPAATVFYFVTRNRPAKVPPHRGISSQSVASHGANPAVAQVAYRQDYVQATPPPPLPPLTIPEAPTPAPKPQNINMINARRVASEAIVYAAEIERKLSDETRRANDMQSVFDRYNMQDIVKLEASREKLKKKVGELSKQASGKRTEIIEAQAVLDGINLEVLYDEVGLIDYEHVAESSVKLGDQLAEVRRSIKDMVRDKTAYTYSSAFTFNNSAAKGKQFSERMAKIMLSAYNAESENAIKSIRGADGSAAAISKISKSLERVTKNGEMVGLSITNGYHQLRLKEVDLAAKHLLAVKLEKELEKERREELREQERASKELLAEQERLSKERQHYLNTLRAVTENGDDEAIQRMQEKIEEIDDAIDNVDSRVANTRAGHVYIISNVGAFGEGIVKIGMTRRLEPMDRVKELGDASVPFRFDTHALFFAEDAVGVENILHKHFAAQRVNRVNLRREFFYTTPHAVLEALKEHRVEIVEFKEAFEAEEYRVSQEIREKESI